jgi:hypothetical protein
MASQCENNSQTKFWNILILRKEIIFKRRLQIVQRSPFSEAVLNKKICQDFWRILFWWDKMQGKKFISIFLEKKENL